MTRLTGTVKGPDGQPVAEAAVHFLEGPVPLPDIAQLTGGDGRFGLAAPAPGTYRLQVNAPGFDAVTVTVEVGEEPELVRDIAVK
jgi:Carboxypeptidase regulatory-like domain